jgi:hypothetical protein
MAGLRRNNSFSLWFRGSKNQGFVAGLAAKALSGSLFLRKIDNNN